MRQKKKEKKSHPLERVKEMKTQREFMLTYFLASCGSD